MARDKEIKLVKQLIDKTRKGLLSWEPTARDDEFLSTLGGRVSFTVQGEATGVLVMRDEFDRVLLSVGSEEIHDVAELHAEARRQALSVDESLDDVLEALMKLDRR